MRRDLIRTSGTMLAAALIMSGCAVGSSGDIDPKGDDGATPPDNDMMVATGDMGAPNNGNSTTPPVGDMAPETPATKRGTLSPSGGGGVLQTPRYKARVILGAPSPAGTSQTPRYKIELGAGAQQHGQR